MKDCAVRTQAKQRLPRDAVIQQAAYRPTGKAFGIRMRLPRYPLEGRRFGSCCLGTSRLSERGKTLMLQEDYLIKPGQRLAESGTLCLFADEGIRLPINP